MWPRAPPPGTAAAGTRRDCLFVPSLPPVLIVSRSPPGRCKVAAVVRRSAAVPLARRAWPRTPDEYRHFQRRPFRGSEANQVCSSISQNPTFRPLGPKQRLSLCVNLIVATANAPERFGYRAEEPPAFCPRTHASMILKSGSSWDVNCLPPWWVSAMPPTSGASGMSSNRLVSGLPEVTSFETI